MDETLRAGLIGFLKELEIKAHDEFNKWDVFDGKPTYLCDKLQDIQYYINELDAKKYKYDSLSCPNDAKIKWLATTSDGKVFGFTIKPRIHKGLYWVTSEKYVMFYQKHIDAYRGYWKDSLMKIE